MLRGRSEPLRAYEPLAEARFNGPATTERLDPADLFRRVA
jgi:hypothetical protein